MYSITWPDSGYFPGISTGANEKLPTLTKDQIEALPFHERLKYFVKVKTYLTATAVDLPQRQQNLFNILQRDGWLVVSQGTTIEPTSLFSILAGGHVMTMLLHRKNSEYGTTAEKLAAKLAVATAASKANITYSAIVTGTEEFVEEMVKPPDPKMIPWWVYVGGGLLGLAVLSPYITPFISRWSKH